MRRFVLLLVLAGCPRRHAAPVPDAEAPPPPPVVIEEDASPGTRRASRLASPAWSRGDAQLWDGAAVWAAGKSLKGAVLLGICGRPEYGADVCKHLKVR